MKPEARKKKLRRKTLAARDSLTPEKRRQLTGQVFANLFSLPEYGRAGSVLAYCGFGSELDTAGLLEAVLRDGKRLFLPRVVRKENRLALHPVDDPASQLVPGVWDIPEPDAELPEARLGDADLALLPGVAFDRQGGRLGYGGGFYDKLLGDKLLGGEARPTTLVAGAFEAQVVEAVPVEPHDVLVEVLVTEAGVFRARGRSG